MKKSNKTGTEKKQPNLDLIEGCLAALQADVELKGQIRKRKNAKLRETEALLELKLKGEKLRFLAAAKTTLNKQHLAPLLHQAKKLAKAGQQLLLCTTRIPEDVGQMLRKHNVAYMDLGGNAYLHAPGLHIQVSGRPQAQVVPQKGGLTGTDLRLLGLYLCEYETLEATQTILAQRAGIAIGTVGKGRKRLAQLRLLEQTTDKGWRIADREEALRRFADGWAAKIRHKLNPRRYALLNAKKHGKLEQRLVKLAPKQHVLLGGELAAAHLTGLLRTEYATLHVQPGEVQNTVKELLLYPVAEGPITLLKRYGQGDALGTTKRPKLPLAQPLLIWTECMGVYDERVAQTAAMLYETHLMKRP